LKKGQGPLPSGTGCSTQNRSKKTPWWGLVSRLPSKKFHPSGRGEGECIAKDHKRSDNKRREMGDMPSQTTIIKPLFFNWRRGEALKGKNNEGKRNCWTKRMRVANV